MGRLGNFLERSVRSLLLAAALVVLAFSTISAQVPTSYGELGMPRGGVRLKDVEENMPPLPDGDTRFVRAYRFNTTSEMMFGHFRGVLGGTRDFDVEQDSATLEPGETTPVSYRLFFHLFDDMCRDSGTAGSGDASTCKAWVRGADKQKAFRRSGRIPFPGANEEVWVEHAVFTWLLRTPDGAWIHWEVQVLDDGMTKDWKRHEPYSKIVIQQITHRKPAPQRATAQEPPAAQEPAPAQEPAVQEPAVQAPPAQDTVPDLQPAPKDSTPSP